jgi:hypothetical protein
VVPLSLAKLQHGIDNQLEAAVATVNVMQELAAMAADTPETVNRVLLASAATVLLSVHRPAWLRKLNQKINVSNANHNTPMMRRTSGCRTSPLKGNNRSQTLFA